MKYYLLKFKEAPYKGASKYATLHCYTSVDSDAEYHISASDSYTLLSFKTKKDATKAANTATEWFNSKPQLPVNKYVGNLEVVEINIP